MNINEKIGENILNLFTSNLSSSEDVINSLNEEAETQEQLSNIISERTASTNELTAAQTQAASAVEVFNTATSQQAVTESTANTITRQSTASINGETIALTAASKAKDEDILKTLLEVTGVEGLTKARLEDISKMDMETLTRLAGSEARALEIKQLTVETLKEEAATAATTAHAAAKKALTGVILTLVSVLVSKLISAISNVIKSTSKAKEQAKELGENLKDLSDEISDYKDNVEGLLVVLKDESSTINEISDARTNLLDIQDQMIKKYGKEADTIKLITKALNGETDAWEDLAKNEYESYVKDYDEDTNHWANFFAGGNLFTSKNSEVAVSQMENAKVNLYEAIYTLGVEQQKMIINFAKQLDTFTYDAGIGNYRLLGNTYAVQEDLEKIASYTKTVFDESDDSVSKYLSQLDKLTDKINDVVDNYGEFYDQYILFNKILADGSDYADDYKDIINAYSDYTDALNTNNDTKIEKAKEAFSKAMSKGLEDATDNIDVQEFLKNMYPSLYQEIASWRFDTDVQAKVTFTDMGGNESTPDKILKDFYNQFSGMTVEEIEAENASATWTEDQINSWTALQMVMKDYYMDLDDVIDKLESMGMHIDTIADQESKKKARAALSSIDFIDRASNTFWSDRFTPVSQNEEIENYINGIDNILSQLTSDELSTIADNVELFTQNYKEELEKLTLTDDEDAIIGDYDAAMESCDNYINSLDDLYKTYNGINNIDRDIIYWDDENIEKYSDFFTSWAEGCGYESAKAMAESFQNTWSTVFGGSDNIDGVEIAYSTMLQTDHGLVPLTQDEFWNYFDGIFEQSWEGEHFDVDKFIQLDSEGSDQIINGQMEHVANMIAAAEGQYLDGIELTADDVIAIATPAYDSETGEDLLPNNDSIFKGFSMHEVQEKALETKYRLAELGDVAEDAGHTMQDAFYIGNLSDEEKQLNAIKNAIEDINTVSETDISPTLSVSEIISELDTQLLPVFDKLKSTWQDIFTEDGFSLSKVDVSMLEDIRSQIESLNSDDDLDIDIDMSSFENLAMVLTNTASNEKDVKNAFNGLATELVNSVDPAIFQVDDEASQLLKTLLKSMGIQNEEELVLTQLGVTYDEYAKAQEEATKAGKDLSEMTDEEIEEFILEEIESGNCGQALALFQLKKKLVNTTRIDTAADVEEIYKLANVALTGADCLTTLANAKNILNKVESGEAVSLTSYEKALSDVESVRDELLNTTVDVDFGLGSGSSKSSSSDTTKSYDWIETAIENIEDEISRLDKIADSSYKSITEKNEALAEQYSLISDEINLYQQAYDEYMKKADSITLSDHYKELVRNGAVSIEDITDKDLQEAISNYQEYYDKAKEIEDTITDLVEKQLDIRVQQYENRADELDNLRENNAITERQYLDEMTALWKEYFENQVQLAEVAKEKKLDLLDEEKDYLETVASAASSILGKQVDSLEEERDKITDGYQNQIDALEKQKSVLQDQLDALEDEEERESKILALQQAQYELARAENQRTQLVYKDGEMVYDTDSSAVSDARQSVKDAELDLLKYNLQSQIDAYDKQIDALNDLIDETEEYYKIQTDSLEKIQDEWEKVLEIYDKAVDIINFKSMFGDDAIERLFSGDMTMIDEWKQAYTDNLDEIDTTANGTVGDITKQYAELAETDLSGLSEQTNIVADKFNALKETVSGAASSIGGVTASTITDGSTTQGGDGEAITNPNNQTDTTTLVGAVSEFANTATTEVPAVKETFNDMNVTVDESIGKVNKLQEAIDTLPDHKTITIDVVVNGGGGYVNGTANANGTAHVEGTAKVQGDWGAHQGGKTLVGELGRELVVSGNRFRTVGDNGAEFVDIKKGDIVFNHQQTEQLLKNGYISSRGRAYANGTISTPTSLPLSPDSDIYKLYHMFDSIVANNERLDSLVFKQKNVFDDLAKLVQNTSSAASGNINQGVNINGGINITCPGVTSREVAEQIGTELEKAVFGLSMKAYQRSHITR